MKSMSSLVWLAQTWVRILALPLWNNRIGEGNNVNALRSHALCKFSSGNLVIDHDRYAWMGAWDDVEALFDQQVAVVSGDLLQVIAQSGALLKHVEHLDAGACNGWSQGVGEQVWTASLSEQVDDLFASGGVAAGCAAQCFAQGAGDDVNTALNAACSAVPRPCLPTKPTAWLSSTITSALYLSARSRRPSGCR